MIPNDAVEAGARTFPGYTPEHEADDLEREINAACRSTARRILKAAAPHLIAEVADDALRAAWDKGYATGQDGLAGRIAEAWEEGREYGIDECAGDVTGGINPYRKHA